MRRLVDSALMFGAGHTHGLAWTIAVALLGVSPCGAASVLAASTLGATSAATSDDLYCMGASTMQPLVEAWAKAFTAREPGARIRVADTTHFSAAGVTAMLAGHANCVTFAREPFPAESAALRTAKSGTPILMPVAGGSYATPHGTFAIAVYVNRANPLRELTMAQLAALFSGSIDGQPLRRWGQLGLSGPWAAQPIHLYGMTPRRSSGNPPGVVNFLDHRVLQGRPWRVDLRVQTDAPGQSALSAIVQRVSQDPDGVGYSGFGYAVPAVHPVALATAADGPYVTGDPATVASARYPLSRQIYLGLARTDHGRLSTQTCAFLSYVLGAGGQRLLALDSMHFERLSAQQLRAARQRLQQGGCNSVQPPVADSASPPPGAAYVEPDGAIRVVGYNDMRSMLEALDRRFEITHPGVRFDLVLKGTRTAPAALAAGTSLFAPMGAEFSAAELAGYRTATGAGPIKFRVAHAALDPRARSSPLAIYVHRGNPLGVVKLHQLRDVFAMPQRVRRWSQLGLTGEWATRSIHPCGLAASTALGVYFRRHVLDGRPYAPDFLGFPESTLALHQAATDTDALCVGDLNQANDAVRVVGLALPDGGGVSIGSRDDLVSGRYPLDRYLYIYIRAHNDARSAALLCQYLRELWSPAGQSIISASVPGYLPLSPAEAASEMLHMDHTHCGS
ncbi:MAG: substrate-binding domain-containing protein [Rhodanobacter sp.]